MERARGLKQAKTLKTVLRAFFIVFIKGRKMAIVNKQSDTARRGIRHVMMAAGSCDQPRFNWSVAAVLKPFIKLPCLHLLLSATAPSSMGQQTRRACELTSAGSRRAKAAHSRHASRGTGALGAVLLGLVSGPAKLVIRDRGIYGCASSAPPPPPSLFCKAQ